MFTRRYYSSVLAEPQKSLHLICNAKVYNLHSERGPSIIPQGIATSSSKEAVGIKRQNHEGLFRRMGCIVTGDDPEVGTFHPPYVRSMYGPVAKLSVAWCFLRQKWLLQWCEALREERGCLCRLGGRSSLNSFVSFCFPLLLHASTNSTAGHCRRLLRGSTKISNNTGVAVVKEAHYLHGERRTRLLGLDWQDGTRSTV